MRIPAISSFLRDYSINPKALINAHNFPTLNDLAQEVIRIDNNDGLYEAMRKESLILEGFNPYEYYRAKLADFLDSIVSQSPQEALRRGKGGLKNKLHRILIRGSDPKAYIMLKLNNKIAKLVK